MHTYSNPENPEDATAMAPFFSGMDPRQVDLCVSVLREFMQWRPGPAGRSRDSVSQPRRSPVAAAAAPERQKRRQDKVDMIIPPEAHAARSAARYSDWHPAHQVGAMHAHQDGPQMGIADCLTQQEHYGYADASGNLNNDRSMRWDPPPNGASTFPSHVTPHHVVHDLVHHAHDQFSYGEAAPCPGVYCEGSRLNVSPPLCHSASMSTTISQTSTFCMSTQDSHLEAFKGPDFAFDIHHNTAHWGGGAGWGQHQSEWDIQSDMWQGQSQSQQQQHQDHQQQQTPERRPHPQMQQQQQQQLYEQQNWNSEVVGQMSISNLDPPYPLHDPSFGGAIF